MTHLQRRALGVTAWTPEQVERLYAAPTNLVPPSAAKDLCESHERLRAELQGAEALIADAEKRETALRAALVNLLQDTQHADHDCGDPNCPVDAARAVIATA